MTTKVEGSSDPAPLLNDPRFALIEARELLVHSNKPLPGGDDIDLDTHLAHLPLLCNTRHEKKN